MTEQSPNTRSGTRDGGAYVAPAAPVPPGTATPVDPPLEFAELHAQELDLIARERARDDIAAGRPVRDSLAGLALSGGGIRSATFNLGIVQGLARVGLLRRFDYLSTVSGGGYTGGFLSALIHRRYGGRSVDAERPLSSWNTVDDAEHFSVRFLRAHSNYLTPRRGLFSGDTMAAVSIYLRNLVLNLLLVVAALSVVLLGVRLIGGQAYGLLASGHANAIGAVCLLAVAIAACAVNLAAHDAGWLRTDLRRSWPVGVLVVGMSGFAAWLASNHFMIAAWQGTQTWAWAAWVALGYTASWAAGLLVCVASNVLAAARGTRRAAAKQQRDALGARPLAWWLQGLVFALVAGAAGGALFKLIADAYRAAWDALYLGGADQALGWAIPLFGAAAVFLVFMFVVTLHIGLVGRQFSEEQREWWGRVGGMCQHWLIMWIGLFGVAYLAAPAIHALGHWAGGIGAAGIATTIGGLLAARSPATGGEHPNRGLEVLARVAPYVFVVVLLAVLSWGIDAVIATLLGAADCNALIFDTDSALDVASKRACTAAPAALPWVAVCLVCVAVVAWLLSARLNVNLFSFHQFYRYRLTRCYLGATRGERKPHPLTGIDPDDDLPLSALRQRPYPLFNTALNLTAGQQLAWQTRKSAAFVLSPLACGYFRTSTREGRGSYRPTERYAGGDPGYPEGIKVGTAIAASGAAASPNMGFHTSPAVAFLLAVFNLRLGRWVPNPGAGRPWDGRADPAGALRYLLLELLARANTQKDYVYVSDGGHFENTGIYELVRRRCRTIVATDCGADPDCRFGDIANAIRRCRVDFGVDIEIDLAPLRRLPGSRQSAAHCAVGTIRYGDRDYAGTLIVIKPSLAEGVPSEVLGYADENPVFPQQTTADQWFDEDQFESYRRLGEHIAARVFAPGTAAWHAART